MSGEVPISLSKQEDGTSSVNSSAGVSDSIENVRRLFAVQNIHDVPISRMYELSAEERTDAFQDLHGASDYVTETPELVQQRLAEMDLSLVRLQEERKAALRMAMERNMEYVQSLKLCFLRAERFNPDRAASRMAGHFETKLHLFQSPELLSRDIRLSDLDDEHDTLALRLGIFQLLQSRDRIGRPIVFIHPGAAGTGKPHDRLSMFRLAFWFVSLAAHLGEDVQRRGIVVIWWGIRPPLNVKGDNRGPGFFNLIFSNTTCSVSAAHAVTDDIRMKSYFDEIAKVVTANYLVRFQTHFGVAMQCQSNLSTFGIPSKILPLSVDGHVHCHDHASFLSQLQKMESEQDVDSLHYPSLFDLVAYQGEPRADVLTEVTPGPKDIILGRGKRGSRYMGNCNLRDAIEDCYGVYEEGRSESRKALARWIYSHLGHSGARFLTYSDHDQLWSELDEETAIGKILHGFRNHRIKVKRESRDMFDVFE